MSQTIQFSVLLQELTKKAYVDLQSLTQKLINTPANERTLKLSKYFKNQRIRFIRVLVLLRWGMQQIDDVQSKQQLISNFKLQEQALAEACNSLHFLFHYGLDGGKVLVYDVPAAVDVLATGTYPRLPSVIKKIAQEDSIPREFRLTDTSEKMVLQRLTELIYVRLLSESIPKEFNVLKIENGRLMCGVSNEFIVTLTLWDAITKPSPWKLLSLKILVQPVKIDFYLGTKQVKVIENIAATRMHATRQPFHELYKTLHSFCRKLQLDIMNSQLSQKDKKKIQVPIHIEYDADGESLKIYYWRSPLDGPSLSTGIVTAPILNYIIIATDKTSQNLQITHYPTLETPLPQLDPTRVSAEQLLFDVATLHSREILLNLHHQFLQSNHQNLRAEVKDGRLSIYLFGSSVLQIFVGVHDGKFLLQGEGCGSLERFEEALNSSTDTFLDIVYELNKNSVLDAFRKMKFLFLASPVMSKSGYNMRESISKDSIYFVFPEFGNSYFLQIQVDSECVPNFYLLSMTNADLKSRQKLSFYLLDQNNKDSLGMPHYGVIVEELPVKENNNNNNNNKNNNNNNNIIAEPENNNTENNGEVTNKRRKVTISLKKNNTTPQRKVIPISSMIFESKDNMDLVYQLLNLALTACRKISQRNFLLEKALSDGMVFNPVPGEPNAFLCTEFINYKSKTTPVLNTAVNPTNFVNIIKEAKLIIKEDAFWKVILIENPDVKLNLDHVRLIEHKRDSSTKSYYDEINSNWVFEYSTINSNCSFTRFYEFDFLGFKTFQNFARQIVEWKQTGHECSSLFEIQTLSAHEIVIVLSTPFENEKFYLAVYWELDKNTQIQGHANLKVTSNITIIPGSNMQYLQFVTTYLSLNQDIIPILISFARNYQTRIQMERFMYSNLMHKSVVLHDLKCPISAGSVTFVTQSIHQFRIIFFQTYAIDVYLFGESGVVIDDGTTTELRENRELTKEMGVLKYMFEVIPQFKSKVYSYSSDFALVLETYYRSLGSCYMMHTVINNSHKIQNLNTKYLQMTHSLPREVPYIDIQYKQNNSCHLKFNIDTTTGQLVCVLTNLCQIVIDCVTSYFGKFIAIPPFRPEAFFAFINLMDSNIGLFSNLVYLFQHHTIEASADAGVGFLISWDTLQIDAVSQIILFELILYEKNQPSNHMQIPIECIASGTTVKAKGIHSEDLKQLFSALNAGNPANPFVVFQNVASLPIEEFRAYCRL